MHEYILSNLLISKGYYPGPFMVFLDIAQACGSLLV